MDEQIYQIIVTLLAILLANFGSKLGRAYKLIKDAIESAKDGILSNKEKALLFDDVWAFIKGFFPNKSK